jgi:hypothetical protein
MIISMTSALWWPASNRTEPGRYFESGPLEILTMTQGSSAAARYEQPSIINVVPGLAEE